MQKETSVVAQNQNSGLKQFIVAKMWTTSKDGSRPGVIRVSRDLPQDIVLKASSVLFLNVNQKREGKMDADFSVSILLPEVQATELIAKQRELASQRVNPEV